jgi:hypothetical protein
MFVHPNRREIIRSDEERGSGARRVSGLSQGSGQGDAVALSPGLGDGKNAAQNPNLWELDRHASETHESVVFKRSHREAPIQI